MNEWCMNFNWSTVPNWAQWIAVDYNGEVWAFEEKPAIDKKNFMWSPNKGNVKFYAYLYQSQEWNKMLMQRKER